MRTKVSTLDSRKFDVAVIGGGVNGASAAQHLSAAGYSVLLVEKGDFASGTSSRSSRLIHCGLRYLAPGITAWEWVFQPVRLKNALKTVRRAMQERQHMVTSQGDRAKRLNFAYPLWRGGTYTAWQVRLALQILETAGQSSVPLNAHTLDPAAARATPLIQNLRDLDALSAVVMFDEYQMDWPERLVMDTVLDAERMGAETRNYTAARAVARKSDGSWSVTLNHAFDPSDAATIEARMVLNMAGIWIDRVNGLASTNAKRRIEGTKGCHIVVQLPPECREYGVATLNSMQEPFYCIPWRGLHYFGPTETLYKGDPDEVYTTEEEIAWLLGEANRLMPALKLKRSDVLFTWAGVRPLTYDPAYPKGKRLRVIHDLAGDGMPGVLAMTNGSMAHQRSAGKEMVAAVQARMAPSGPPKDVDYSARRFPKNQNSPPLLDHFTEIKLSDLVHAARHEHALTLTDLLHRRTGAVWTRTNAIEAARKAADAVADIMGWDAARVEREVADYVTTARRLFTPREP